MNNILKLLVDKLGEITQNLFYSISFNDNFLLLDKTKIQTAYSLFEDVKCFVERNNLNKLEFIQKGIDLYKQIIVHISVLSSRLPSPKFDRTYYSTNLIHSIYSMIAVFENIDRMANNSPPVISIFEIHNYTKMYLLFEYPDLRGESQNELCYSTPKGRALMCYPIWENTMYIHTTTGTKTVDISNYNGDIYVLGIMVDEQGDFKLFPDPIS